MRAEDLVGPIINLNGTAKIDLVQQYHEAITALNVADRALRAAWPHPRDYQTEPVGVFDTAQRQHRSRVERVVAVRAEMEHLLDQILGPRP